MVKNDELEKVPPENFFRVIFISLSFPFCLFMFVSLSFVPFFYMSTATKTKGLEKVQAESLIVFLSLFHLS